METSIKKIEQNRGNSYITKLIGGKEMGKRIKDLTGLKFNRLEVICLEKVCKSGKVWTCRCDCGNITNAHTGSLTTGRKKSCGCLRHEIVVERNKSEIQRNAVKESWKKDDGTRRNQIAQLGYDSKGANNFMYGKCGELSPCWKGGITPISLYMRHYTEKWKRQIRNEYNNKCYLTGIECNTNNSATHHLVSFNTILKQAHEFHNIPFINGHEAKLKDYTREEIDKIATYIESCHESCENGVLLHNELHDLFHRIYGIGDNTKEQFEEFELRYLNGEFNEELMNVMQDNHELTKGTKASLVA